MTNTGNQPTALNEANEALLRAGIANGKTYKAIGESYDPPTPPGTVYRHAVKLGLADQHPLRGRRGKPYSLNPYNETRG